MKKQEKFYRSIIAVALVTVLILMIPLVAMQFTDEVKWNAPDFVVMGALIFSTGMGFILITRGSPNVAYRIAAALTFATAFLMIWANLAVGLIGSGPNPGNLMYMAVPAAAILGAFLSNLNPSGMERTMYVTTVLLVIVTLIAFLANMDEYPSSSPTDILAVSGFFAMLFIVSGLIFRFAAQQGRQESEKSKG
jgi:heme/copper-type cytochrome/quinol oxidase subunit 4